MYSGVSLWSTVFGGVFLGKQNTKKGKMLHLVPFLTVILVQAYSRLAAVLSLLHLSAAAVSALEQLADIVRKQGGRDAFKTAARLDEARRDVRRKPPVHHYRLLGLTQACSDAEVSFKPQNKVLRNT